MAVKSIPVSTSSVRYHRTADDKYLLAGATDWLAAGKFKGTYTSFLKAAFASTDWADIVQITKAELVLITPADAKGAFEGAAPTNQAKVTLIALKGTFADNTSEEFDDSWNGDVTPTNSTLSRSAIVDDKVDFENRIDIRRFIKYWAPVEVKVKIGSTVYKGTEHTNYGMQLSIADGEVVVASEKHSDLTIQPRIDLEYIA